MRERTATSRGIRNPSRSERARRRPRLRLQPRALELEARVVPATIDILNGVLTLSSQRAVANDLSLALVENGTTLQIRDAAETISPLHPGVVVVDPNTVRVPLALFHALDVDLAPAEDFHGDTLRFNVPTAPDSFFNLAGTSRFRVGSGSNVVEFNTGNVPREAEFLVESGNFGAYGPDRVALLDVANVVRYHAPEGALQTNVSLTLDMTPPLGVPAGHVALRGEVVIAPGASIIPVAGARGGFLPSLVLEPGSSPLRFHGDLVWDVSRDPGAFGLGWDFLFAGDLRSLDDSAGSVEKLGDGAVLHAGAIDLFRDFHIRNGSWLLDGGDSSTRGVVQSADNVLVHAFATLGGLGFVDAPVHVLADGALRPGVFEHALADQALELNRGLAFAPGASWIVDVDPYDPALTPLAFFTNVDLAYNLENALLDLRFSNTPAPGDLLPVFLSRAIVQGEFLNAPFNALFQLETGAYGFWEILHDPNTHADLHAIRVVDFSGRVELLPEIADFRAPVRAEVVVSALPSNLAPPHGALTFTLVAAPIPGLPLPLQLGVATNSSPISPNEALYAFDLLPNPLFAALGFDGFLPVGDYLVRVDFASNDDLVQFHVGDAALRIQPLPTSVAVVSSSNPAPLVGLPVVFEAVVHPSILAVDGAFVQFLADGIPVGPSVPVLGTNVLSPPIADLAPGLRQITAILSPATPNYVPSASAPFAQTILQPALALRNSSGNDAIYGSVQTLSALVDLGEGPGIGLQYLDNPVVRFFADGRLLGEAPVDAFGRAHLQYDTRADLGLAPGVIDPVVVFRALLVDDALPPIHSNPVPVAILPDLVVRSTLDAGLGTLRAAIESANFFGSRDVIRFDVHALGTRVVPVANPLPPLVDPTEILGRADAASPRVRIVSASTFPIDSGLRVNPAAAGSAIRGLEIAGFLNGLRVVGGAGHLVEDNAFLDNLAAGLLLDYATDSRIRDNLASGNGGALPGVGIHLRDGSDRNILERNIVGLESDGSTPRGNTRDGILLQNSAQNTVLANLVSANGRRPDTEGAGVRVEGPRADGNAILLNRVGTDADGLLPRPNDSTGILVHNADATRVEGNLVSGNALNGIMVARTDAPALSAAIRAANGPTGNVIRGNYVGTTADGRSPLPNGTPGQPGGDGLYLLRSVGDLVADNLVSGNRRFGISAYLGGGHVLQNNVVGLDADSAAALPNGADGVFLNRAPSVLVLDNVVAANRDNAVRVEGVEAVGIRILSNVFGGNRDNRPFPNFGYAVYATDGAPAPVLTAPGLEPNRFVSVPVDPANPVRVVPPGFRGTPLRPAPGGTGTPNNPRSANPAPGRAAPRPRRTLADRLAFRRREPTAPPRPPLPRALRAPGRAEAPAPPVPGETEAS